MLLVLLDRKEFKEILECVGTRVNLVLLGLLVNLDLLETKAPKVRSGIGINVSIFSDSLKI